MTTPTDLSDSQGQASLFGDDPQPTPPRQPAPKHRRGWRGARADPRSLPLGDGRLALCRKASAVAHACRAHGRLHQHPTRSVCPLRHHAPPLRRGRAAAVPRLPHDAALTRRRPRVRKDPYMTDTTTDRGTPMPEGTLAAMREARARFDKRHPGNPSTESASESGDLFTDIADITAWLDDANPPGAHEDAMRVLKLTEEAGEAAAAYIGMVGQNPRKGITHSLDDLLSELADVAITALCAIQHFTQSETTTRTLVNAKTAHVAFRAGRARS